MRRRPVPSLQHGVTLLALEALTAALAERARRSSAQAKIRADIGSEVMTSRAGHQGSQHRVHMTAVEQPPKVSGS